MTAPQPQTKAASASTLQPVSRLRKHSRNSATIAPRPVSLNTPLGSRRRVGGPAGVRPGARVRAEAEPGRGRGGTGFLAGFRV
ncbi:MAG: hypothetical protein ACRDOU_25760 [Streptosporangiaceae bacterium]